MHLLAQANPPLDLPEVAWRALAPELALGLAGVVVLMFVAWFPRARRGLLAGLTLAGLAVAGGLTAWNWDLQTVAFDGAVSLDGIARYARLILLASGALAVLMALGDTRREPRTPPEVFPLLLFSLLGMVLLAEASDLLVVFIALELLSLALYVMAGATRRLRAQEAAMKYFLLGAFSSAFLLYGIALVYGVTGTTSLRGILAATADPTLDLVLLMAGAGLLAVGFLFKVAAVPFHMWTPDVYQGAPTPVTAFMAAGTKVAGFAVLLRVFGGALGGLAPSWLPVMVTVAVVTMLVGAALAVVQSDLKRMLAYSSIAHAGYLLIGVVAAATIPAGYSSTMFYLLTYAFMVMGAFMVVEFASRPAGAGGAGGPLGIAGLAGALPRVWRAGEPAPAGGTGPGPIGAPPGEPQRVAPALAAEPGGTVTTLVPAGEPSAARDEGEELERSSLEDYRGFARRHPWAGGMLALFMFGLTGMPPLAGFWGKYYVFQAGIQAGYTWLVVVAVASSAVAAFFYLRVVVVSYLQPGDGAAIGERRRSPVLGVAIAIAGLLTVAIGLAPQIFVTAARTAERLLG